MQTKHHILTIIYSILLIALPSVINAKVPNGSLEGHTGAIFGVAVSKDGTMIATASSDKTIRIWDSTTKENIITLEGHTASIHSVAFSPNGETLISGDQDKKLLIWDLKSGDIVNTIEFSWVVRTVAFSRNGRFFAAGDWFGGNSLRIWDADTQNLLHNLPAGRVDDIAFSPDGKYLASGSLDDGKVLIWDPDTGQLLNTINTDMKHVLGVVFADKGQTLICGGTGGIQIWDVNSETRKKNLLRQDEGTVECLALNPDGRLLASGYFDSEIKLWDLETRTLIETLEGHVSRVNSLAFTPDGHTLVSGGQSFDALLWETTPLDDINFSVDPKNKITSLWGKLKQQ